MADASLGKGALSAIAKSGGDGVAAFFIIVQRDMKRLLAYSSVENMGLIALGLGIDPGLVGEAVDYMVRAGRVSEATAREYLAARGAA